MSEYSASEQPLSAQYLPTSTYSKYRWVPLNSKQTNWVFLLSNSLILETMPFSIAEIHKNVISVWLWIIQEFRLTIFGSTGTHLYSAMSNSFVLCLIFNLPCAAKSKHPKEITYFGGILVSRERKQMFLSGGMVRDLVKGNAWISPPDIVGRSHCHQREVIFCECGLCSTIVWRAVGTVTGLAAVPVNPGREWKHIWAHCYILSRQGRIQDFGQGAAEFWPQGGPWARNLLKIGVKINWKLHDLKKKILGVKRGQAPRAPWIRQCAASVMAAFPCEICCCSAGGWAPCLWTQDSDLFRKHLPLTETEGTSRLFQTKGVGCANLRLVVTHTHCQQT